MKNTPRGCLEAGARSPKERQPARYLIPLATANIVTLIDPGYL